MPALPAAAKHHLKINLHARADSCPQQHRAAESVCLQINGIFPQNISSQAITLTPQTTGGVNGTPETITGHNDATVLLYEHLLCFFGVWSLNSWLQASAITATVHETDAGGAACLVLTDLALPLCRL